MRKTIAHIAGATGVLLLTLAACNSSVQRERTPIATGQSDQKGACWTREIYACEDYQKVRRVIISRGYDYRMTIGYHEMIRKVGRDPEWLKARYGDIEHGLIALGCGDQAPGLILAVFRPGDPVRDYWCSRKAGAWGGSNRVRARPRTQWRNEFGFVGTGR